MLSRAPVLQVTASAQLCLRLWLLSCLSKEAVPICRFEESRSALLKALVSRELFGVPLLVLANKQDLQDAQPPEAMQQMLGLDDLKQTFR